MKPKVLDGLVLAYGLLLIALAVVGFLAGSVISLIAGGVSGALVLFFLAITAKKRQIGRIGVAIVSLLLFLNFAGAIASRLTAPTTATPPKAPIWQAYVLAPASLVVFLALGLGHMSAMKARRLE